MRMAAMSDGKSHEERTRSLQDKQELIDILAEKGGGSFLRGWRQHLDADGTLEVRFAAFCQAAAQIAWSGDVYMLLGGDQDVSSLTLDELCPSSGALVRRLKRWVKDKFGSTAELHKACEKASDAQGAGQVTREGFVTTVITSGFSASVADMSEVFDMCDVDNAESIQASSLIFLEEDDEVRDELLAKSRITSLQEWRYKVAQEYVERDRPHVSPHHRLAPRPWQASTFEKLPFVACRRRYDRRREEVRKQKFAKEEFWKYVHSTYGNEIRFFRRILDAGQANQYTLTQVQLRYHMGQANVGNVFDTKALWKALDNDDDCRVRLEELAPERGCLLARFQQWCCAHPQLKRAVGLWDHAEAKDARSRRRQGAITSNSKMKFGAVVEVLKALGWPHAHDRDVRGLLLTSLDLAGCGFLTRADLEWLDGWRASDWLYADPDPEAWEELRALLLSKYGHLLRAWRMVLDRVPRRLQADRLRWEHRGGVAPPRRRHVWLHQHARVRQRGRGAAAVVQALGGVLLRVRDPLLQGPRRRQERVRHSDGTQAGLPQDELEG